MALADHQTQVQRLVRDASGTLNAADIDRAIEHARLRYSQDAPREQVQDVVWATAGHFADLPEGWVDGSWLLGAEHPIGQVPPAVVDLAQYTSPTGLKLMAADALDVGAVVRVRFALPHELHEAQGAMPAADTIPEAHRPALAAFAASVLCLQLSTHYSGERDASVGADHSNTDSRARNYAQRAKDYRASYYAQIGKADPQGGGGNGGDGGAGAAPAGFGATPVASISSFAGRTRNSLTAGVVL